jgi:hypothetical protein
VNKGAGRSAVITAVLFSWLAAAACAEPLETTVGLTINALSGQHQVGQGQVDRLSFAPLPLAELTFRSGTESVRIEGLPPLALGNFDQSFPGGSSTRLSILNATYRHALRGGWFAGIGETVYNQDTAFAQRSNLFFQRGAFFEPIVGSLRQYSRVTGLRLEAGQTVHLRRAGIEYFVAVDPSMHGIAYTRVPTFGGRIDTFGDGETAAQVDLIARVIQPVSKHGELLYGLRYLNFTARYDDVPGQLADRNVGFAPSLGYRVKF